MKTPEQIAEEARQAEAKANEKAEADARAKAEAEAKAKAKADAKAKAEADAREKAEAKRLAKAGPVAAYEIHLGNKVYAPGEPLPADLSDIDRASLTSVGAIAAEAE